MNKKIENINILNDIYSTETTKIKMHRVICLQIMYVNKLHSKSARHLMSHKQMERRTNTHEKVLFWLFKWACGGENAISTRRQPPMHPQQPASLAHASKFHIIYNNSTWCVCKVRRTRKRSRSRTHEAYYTRTPRGAYMSRARARLMEARWQDE